MVSSSDGWAVGSDSRNPGSDGDGISDGAEVNSGSNPLVAPAMVGGYIVYPIYPKSIVNVEIWQNLFNLCYI